jgi:hypothetical protein
MRELNDPYSLSSMELLSKPPEPRTAVPKPTGHGTALHPACMNWDLNPSKRNLPYTTRVLGHFQTYEHVPETSLGLLQI